MPSLVSALPELPPFPSRRFSCTINSVDCNMASGSDLEMSPGPRTVTHTRLSPRSPPGSVREQMDQTPSGSQPPQSEYEYPDGGWEAWRQVLAGHFVNALTWGYPSTFGVFQLYYVETLHLPRAQVSWIGSIQLFVFLSLATFTGRLADAGFARHAVFVGSCVVLLGTFMTSLATTYYQILLAQGICTGVGMGLLFMPTISIISSYFYKRRSFALALAAVGNGTGSTVLPATVQYLTPKIGFPWAVRCAGFIALLFAVIANCLLKTRLAPRRSGPLIEWTIFKEPAYVLLVCGCFFFYWSFYFCFFYINSFARDVIGFSTASSVQLLLITNAVGMPGRPLVGWIADKYTGPLNAFIVCIAGIGCMLYGWTGVRDRTGMYVYAVLYGFFAGSSQGIYGPAVASLTKDPSKMGTRFGMVSSIMSLAVLAGPPTAGALIDVSGGKYVWAQVWGGSSMLLGAAMVAAARAWITGGKLLAKA